MKMANWKLRNAARIMAINNENGTPILPSVPFLRMPAGWSDAGMAMSPEEEITMELTYLPDGNYYNKQGKPILAYIGIDLPVFIDAMTGKSPYWFGVDDMQMG